MELIIGLIIGYFILKGIAWLIGVIVDFIASVFAVVGPVLRGIMLVLAAAGFAYGALSALYYYGKALNRYKDPFATYVDKAKHKQPARRSYFFGPGYKQLKNTIGDAWTSILVRVSEMWEHMTTNGFLLGALMAVFIIPMIITLVLVGGSITVCLFALHSAILLAVMAISYVVFTITYLVDWIYLYVHNIRSVCPRCKHRYRIPMFKCPSCGEMHDRLIPGAYGIWYRRCQCGHKMPTTFLMGRSKLDAFCPQPGCRAPLASSSARQIGIQMVGGPTSGKTVLLAAMYHCLRERMKSYPAVRMQIPDFAKVLFERLELSFEGQMIPPTPDRSAVMYPMILATHAADTARQLSLYDVAGEIFDDSHVSNAVEAHFSYCDGLMLLIDPFSSKKYRDEAEEASGAIVNHSEELSETVVQNLATMLVRIKHLRPGSRIDIPVAVIITKADMYTVRSAVGYPKINSEMRRNPGKYGSQGEARDAMCRQFLMSIGLNVALNSIDSYFSNVHFFPVSAMGHKANGEAYDPWGVMQPFDWLFGLADPEFAQAIGVKNPE